MKNLIQGIHHGSMKCCTAAEYEEVRRFYGEILGLPLYREWDKGVLFQTGAGFIEVFNDGEEPLSQGTIRHIALATEDVDGCIEAVRQAGYEVTTEPKEVLIPSEPPIPARIAFCRGPLGEEIEFFHQRPHRKICILKASPRKRGNTYSLVEVFAQRMQEKGYECREFDLYDKTIGPCLACRACQQDWSGPNCIQKDDMEAIFEAVLDSDLIVLASPIYAWYCTAPLKAAMDRMVYALNKYYGAEKGPALWAGKSVALITTCGYRTEKGTDLLEEGVKRYCKHSGLTYLGKLAERHLGYDTVFMDEEKRQHALDFADSLVF